MPADSGTDTRTRRSGRNDASSAVSPETLLRMASHYLARTSASGARLRDILDRKVRRRCELRELPVPDDDALRTLVDGVLARLTRAGLVDDAAYGRGRAAALARKGWPGWRVRSDLRRQEIDVAEVGLADAVDLDDPAQARRLAERKRLGPFRAGERDLHRDKDIGRLVRAGFPVSIARAVVDGEDA